jgi:hypothetical protein
MLLLFSAFKARGQGITAYTGQPMEFTVDVQFAEEEDITWEIYDDFVGINMVVVPGNCPPASGDFIAGNTGSSVQILWNVPGLYLVKVRAVNACPTDNMKFYLVEVIQSLPVATLLDPGMICEGDTGYLVVELTGEAPWSLILFDGVNYTTYDNILAQPFTIPVSPTTTTTYTVTEVTNIDGSNDEPSNSVTLIVNPRPVNGPIYQYVP